MELILLVFFVFFIAIISCLMFCNGWETEKDEEDFDYGEDEEEC